MQGTRIMCKPYILFTQAQTAWARDSFETLINDITQSPYQKKHEYTYMQISALISEYSHTYHGFYIKFK